MAAEPDAELYLRMTVERALLDGEQGRRPGSSVWSAAAALRAVDAIGPELAEQIAVDYDLACFLRNRGGGAFMHHRAMQPQGIASKLPDAARQTERPPRALTCNLDLEAPWGQVTVLYVVLSDTFTKVAVHTIDRSRQVMGGMGSLSQIRLSDDRGGSSPAKFTGVGTPDGYTGILTTDIPLNRDTRWIAAGPLKVELPDGDGVSVTVQLESLPHIDPALRHLWSSIIHGGRPLPMSGGDLDAAIAALAFVGAIDPDSDEITEIRHVAGAVSGPWNVPQRFQPQPPPNLGRLPEPWSSLVATRRRSVTGREGVTAVGAVTPPIDERIVVIVAGLHCHPDSFSIQIDAYPGVALSMRGLPGEEIGPLSWWAEDDRGGVYLGGPTNWSSSDEIASGTIMFHPGIDPKCRRIRLMPTGTNQRAVIDVPLPWNTDR